VRKGKKLIASIADNGPGIPAEDRERVFRRFYRLERSASIPGTGLGLALVAAVAELHGIELGAEDNAPGLRIRTIFDAFEPDELRTSTGYVMAINPGARPL
jgi:signal transduction histidine kinase